MLLNLVCKMFFFFLSICRVQIVYLHHHAILGMYIHQINTKSGDQFREHRRNDKDAYKPFSRHFNLPNLSVKHTTACGFSLHLRSSKSHVSRFSHEKSPCSKSNMLDLPRLIYFAFFRRKEYVDIKDEMFIGRP